MEKTAEEIVIALAEWSKKYPRSQVYGMSRKETIDGELIAIEEMAKAYNPQEFRTEGASTVPTDEEIELFAKDKNNNTGFRNKDWNSYHIGLVDGCKWMREKMLKAKGAEDKEMEKGFNYCQRQIEGKSKCKMQCEHCTEYYKPLEKNRTEEVLKSHIDDQDQLIYDQKKELEELKAENEEMQRELDEKDRLMSNLANKFAGIENELDRLKTLQPNNTLRYEKILEILKDELWLNQPFGNETPHDKKPTIEGIEDAVKAICSLPNAATSADKELLWKFFERGNDHDFTGNKEDLRKDFESFYFCFNFRKSDTSAEAINKAIEQFATTVKSISDIEDIHWDRETDEWEVWLKNGVANRYNIEQLTSFLNG